MPEIVLTTFNAKYAHAAFGLRYLLANLGDLRFRAGMLEFDISQRTTDVLEAVLAKQPRVIGLGVYIWNAEQSLRLVRELKRVRPDLIVVLGGPEVSYETDEQEICRLADYVITREGDLAFAELCRQLLVGSRPSTKTIPAELPRMEQLVLPYDLYDEQDIAHRVIYVEASRGCPFKCEFCLSSLDVPVRNVPLEPFLAEMQKLLDRGARQFKFVDRTFNLNLNVSRSILQFFWERYEPGLFVHFEMIPDRLPEALRESIRRFPPGALQFEVGVQTFNEQVAARISRRQDNARLADNLRYLRDETGVHVHADLIVGLPGEDIESFAAGFDRLVALGPHEIQVGMLKRLRGTPIVRHDAEFGMVYSPNPPYEIMQTNCIDFATMQRMRRFSRYWDLICNSGNFTKTAPMIWSAGMPGEGKAERGALAEAGTARQEPRPAGSPFWGFLELTDWLSAKVGRSHSISLHRLAELLFGYLTAERRFDSTDVAQSLWTDYQRVGRRDIPEFLLSHIGRRQPTLRPRGLPAALPRRQARHLA